ncbi:MAG: hypothetical protein BGO28_01525 [Alphaproteobacteria bacterium 43-37]|nr:MAG: hypothetical protein BGO28_01525 [Alphaproteobacteria bacterium 43-37]
MESPLRPFNKYPLEAFGLIEVAITLVIIGIVAWTGEKALQSFIKIKEQQTTNARLHDVQEAIRAYVAKHDRLPCPAHPKSNGVEALTNFRCDINPGLIPYTALGLSKNHQVDGASRLILYAAHPSLTAPPELDSLHTIKLCEIDNEHGITIHKTNVPASHKTPPIAYTLISFGAKGWSPFDQMATPTPEEKENDSSNLIFIEGDGITIRHHVVWKNAEILAIEVYGETCKSKKIRADSIAKDGN